MKPHILLYACLFACGGKTENAGKPIDNVAGAKPTTNAAFGSTDGLLDKWQGAWMMQTNSDTFEAWEVKGTKVTSWDGKQERVRDLQLDAACSGQLIDKSGSGSAASSSITFAFAGDKIHTGQDAGFKQGEQILACRFGMVFTRNGTSCTAQQFQFENKIDRSVVECKVEGGEFVITWEDASPVASTARFKVAGDLLAGDRPYKVEKVASFAEAKSRLETFKKM